MTCKQGLIYHRLGMAATVQWSRSCAHCSICLSCESSSNHVIFVSKHVLLRGDRNARQCWLARETDAFNNQKSKCYIWNTLWNNKPNKTIICQSVFLLSCLSKMHASGKCFFINILFVSRHEVHITNTHSLHNSGR